MGGLAVPSCGRRRRGHVGAVDPPGDQRTAVPGHRGDLRPARGDPVDRRGQRLQDLRHRRRRRLWALAFQNEDRRRSTTAWRSAPRSAAWPSATRSTARSGSRRRPTAATPGRSSTRPGCRRPGRTSSPSRPAAPASPRPGPDDLHRVRWRRGGAAFVSTDRGYTWSVTRAPLVGGPSAGVFSVRFRDRHNGIAVGGDFATPTSSLGNAAWSSDGGISVGARPRPARPGTGPGRPGPSPP